ncbi:hypothetical protein Q1695_007454 [Nippostrongylus brasiliensis]|nr:hypothetical protein Q1695_007454 [Nippostrongylus brasiliensis]
MVDLRTLQKPLRSWETEEVTAFLKGLITVDEEEIFLHNKVSGSRLKDFCCSDFLVHVLHLNEASATKVMNVLQPYLDEMEDPLCIPKEEYCFIPRKRFKFSRKRIKREKDASVTNCIVQNMDLLETGRITEQGREIDSTPSGGDRTTSISQMKTAVAPDESSSHTTSCSTQTDENVARIANESN